MDNELELLEKYIRANFEYDSAGSLIDPLDAVVISPVNESQLATSPFKEAGARMGDYWVDDSVYGFIFRIENGVVTKLWSND
ncbi:MAG: hypothetical protein EOM46_05725 [Gammaproteobacteria bacterium]|nr:hypothetical protein [Gammaproteobacteria bacterium]